MNRLNLAPLLVALTLSCSVTAQTAAPTPTANLRDTVAQDTVDVPTLMQAYHDAVVGRDGNRLAALFLPDATWVNVLSDEAFARLKKTKPDAVQVRISNYKAFASLVSTTKDNFNPTHTNLKISTDGTIASVYFDFAFLINGKEQNRGSETWQLVKGANGWRIAAITYSSNPRPS
ncbi:YybH family protein [Terriglobus roseus]|uniref:SnoaL-like domain-containing protein n=1 Tax=Terriglobus roseus TaxID=392734 RepID=A0A1H4R671_9BACT|nr:nuclear transport factor 2 family protein [Terriglobus roseus]SEC27317.1 SnoaL-like domain-containing protein [Terriglobus roseus]